MHSSPDRLGAVLSGSAVEGVAVDEIGPGADANATARLDGFRVGREEGHAIGLAEGTEAAMASMALLLDGLRLAARQATERVSELEDRLPELAMGLALEVAEAIVGGDLSLIETGEDVIVRALGLRRTGEDVRIHVHPDHPALSDIPTRPGVELVADAELRPNDAYAEIGEGIADLSVSSALERVRSALA